MSKAQVGKESVLKKDATLDIIAIHASIYETRFDTSFYR
jgi:ubiquitin-like 1-activating enzyme E1 B